MSSERDPAAHTRDHGVVVHDGRDDGSDAIAAGIQQIVLWSQSKRVLRESMLASRFPLPGDEAAFRLYVEIVRRGPRRPADLADALGTGRSNVSKIVARLEATGLVQRREHSHDTRSVVVELTHDGQSFTDSFVSYGRAFFSLLLSSWPESDVEALVRLLPRLAMDLDALTAARVTQGA